MKDMIGYCGLDCENAMRILQRSMMTRRCVRKPQNNGLR